MNSFELRKIRSEKFLIVISRGQQYLELRGALKTEGFLNPVQNSLKCILSTTDFYAIPHNFADLPHNCKEAFHRIKLSAVHFHINLSISDTSDILNLKTLNEIEQLLSFA